MLNSKNLKNVICFCFYLAFMIVAFDFKILDGMTSLTDDDKKEEPNKKVVVENNTEVTNKKDRQGVIVLYSSQRDDNKNIQNKEIASVDSKPEVTIAYDNKKLDFSEQKTESNSNISISKKQSSPTVLDYIEAIKTKKWEYAELIDRYIVKYDWNSYIVLTIKPDLQNMLEGVLSKYDMRMSAGIIQNPFTGAVLAVSSSNKNVITSILDDDFISNNWAFKSTFPVASIFKIITSSAGIDNDILDPNSNYLSDGKRFMKVWRAFANSHNGVFARMARQIGKESIEEYATAFGFNKKFFFDLPVSKSVAEMPVNQKDFEEASAGLNKNFIVSPIHVSQIVSTVVNKGVTMKPYLVDYVVRDGQIVFKRKPFALSAPIKPNTAKLIRRMMHATTASGTGKKGFGGYKSCPELAKYCAGKTGTLTGSYPNYLFTWFGGYTTIGGETLTITTLVGQSNHNSTKAASVAGQIAFELYKIGVENGTAKKGLIASR